MIGDDFIQQHTVSLAKPSEDYPFHLLVYYELYPDIFGSSPDKIAENAYLIKAIRDQVDLDQPLGPLEFSFRERGTNRILTANLQYMTYQTGDFPYAIIMPSAEQLLAELRDDT